LILLGVARCFSARGLQLHYTASRGFVSDSWAFLFRECHVAELVLVVTCFTGSDFTVTFSTISFQSHFILEFTASYVQQCCATAQTERRLWLLGLTYYIAGIYMDWPSMELIITTTFVMITYGKVSL